jgi:signal peptidase II
LVLIFIMVGVLILDQFTKYLAWTYLLEIGSMPLILNIFHLTYVENTGAAFSLLSGKTSFFVLVTVIALAASLYVFFRIEQKWVLLRVGLALVMGGALGNLIDRIRLGFVIDFLDLRIWPVFNIADCAIVVGVVLIAWVLCRNDISFKKK